MKVNWWNKIFPPKYYLAPPGYDPTVDPLPDGWNSRRAGDSGCALWLGLGLAVLAMGGLVYGSWWMWTRPARAEAAELAAASQPALAAQPDALPTLRPSKTPVVFPTVGVVSATPFGGVTSSPTPVVFPTLPGGPLGPSPTSPAWQPPTAVVVTVVRVVNSGGGSSAPLPTYTPYPTYTPRPVLAAVTLTPTRTPSATSSPTPTQTATCTPTATATSSPTPTETATATETVTVEPSPTLEAAATETETPPAEGAEGVWVLLLPLVIAEPGSGGC